MRKKDKATDNDEKVSKDIDPDNKENDEAPDIFI